LTDGGYSKSLEKSFFRPLHPGWLVIITLIAGLAGSGPVVGATLYRYGYRKVGFLTGFLICLLGLMVLAGTFLWEVEWFWSTILISGIHLLSATGIFFAMRPLHLNYQLHHPRPAQERGSLKKIVTGLITGAYIGCLLGVISSVVYILLIDRLFSTLIPISFEDATTGTRVFIMIFFLTVSGIVAGGFIGRHRPRVSVTQIFLFGIGLIWAYLTWLTAMEITVAIPEFQAGAATGGGWDSLVAPFILENLLVGFWWPVFLMFYIMSPPDRMKKLLRGGLVLAINLAAGITFSITFGYPADIFLSAGRHLERNARTEKALWCYERGLKKEPENRVASYLQYRVALLNHKLYQPDKAKNGFKRVVAKYTWNKNLVKKANRFLDNLERSAGKKRVVLPGVETRTEYKGGYCVPNSLALAMRFWGADISARGIGKRITGLGSGTFVVNQSWFAEQEGFRHVFLPLADLNDIKQCIDAGFPVLVYVPAHVFAIFGYDEALETFVTYDIATHDVWVEYLQKDFIKSWKKQATTMVLAYPPDKELLLPDNIKDRIIRLSDNYLHFQLHFFDTPAGTVSVPHLFKAAGRSGEFFFPITILYSDFPGLRRDLVDKFGSEPIYDAIKSYFWEDFDEGIHRAGQYHNQRWARPDWALRFSVNYLIGQKQYDLVKTLTSRIKLEGRISDGILADAGIIDLAQGNLEDGLDRLSNAKGANKPLYTGLAKLKTGDKAGAVRDFVKIVKNSTWEIMRKPKSVAGIPSVIARKNANFNDTKRLMSLDEYGFPHTAVANTVLVSMAEYGESSEDLERNWENWIHHVPFDAPVVEKMAGILKTKTAQIDKKKKPAIYQRLSRKLSLLEIRAARYNFESFKDAEASYGEAFAD
jgi:hypothetical protein